jgi:hypothetical protein
VKNQLKMSQVEILFHFKKRLGYEEYWKSRAEDEEKEGKKGLCSKTMTVIYHRLLYMFWSPKYDHVQVSLSWESFKKHPNSAIFQITNPDEGNAAYRIGITSVPGVLRKQGPMKKLMPSAIAVKCREYDTSYDTLRVFVSETHVTMVYQFISAILRHESKVVYEYPGMDIYYRHRESNRFTCFSFCTVILQICGFVEDIDPFDMTADRLYNYILSECSGSIDNSYASRSSIFNPSYRDTFEKARKKQAHQRKQEELSRQPKITFQ